MANPRLVHVLWIDSAGSDRWEGGPIDTLMCESVGWLIAKNKRRIVVAAARADHNSPVPWGMQMAIPRGAIKEIRDL